MLKKGIEVNRNYEEIPKVNCYPDELNQVWTNLIHNSIQAMGNEGTLDVSIKSQKETVQIIITDSGSGIPEEIVGNIFDPFFTTKPAGEGSGLGLDIVKKIVDKHDGEIFVKSRTGKTSFTVTLPLN
jgi:two-component system NtrC family sensor kinase